MTRAPGSGISEREIGLMWTGLPGDPTLNLTLDLCREGGRMKTRLDEHRFPNALRDRLEALVNEVLDKEGDEVLIRQTCSIDYGFMDPPVDTNPDEHPETAWVRFQTRFDGEPPSGGSGHYGVKFTVTEEGCAYHFVHEELMRVDGLIRRTIVDVAKHLFRPAED